MNQWSVQRIVGAVAAAVVIIGAFLPWASISGLVSVSLNGTSNGASDGWFTAAFATVALVAFLVHQRVLYVVAAVLSVLGMAIAIYDIVDISRLAGDTGLDSVTVSVGIGLWLTAIGIVTYGVLTIVCRSQVPKTPAIQQPTFGNYPQAGYPNYQQPGQPNNPPVGYPNYPQTGTVPHSTPPQAPPAGGSTQPPPPPPTAPPS